MTSGRKYAVPPPEVSGFRIFIRSSYSARYNFAVDNYNAVSATQKKVMRDFFVLLYRSVVTVVWLIAMGLAILALFYGMFFIGTLILSVIYILLSLYNAYVFFDNRNLLNATRLLPAKVAGPDGKDHEWVSVPINSSSANERLASVEPSAIVNVRKEFAGSNQHEVDCLVYTSRYADRYPAFPKELFLHLFGFIAAIILGIIMWIL